MLLLILLNVCAISQLVQADTSVYVFDPTQSTVVQTGGFASVDETYPIEGYFQLSVDIDAGLASFEKVDANMLEPNGFLSTVKLGVLFNMTALSGTVVDDMTIEFEGKTADGTESDVRLRLSFSDGLAHLTGKTTPPPNSADMFFYDVNAVAIKKYAGGTGEPKNPYQISTAEDLITLGETPDDYDKHFILTTDIDLDPNLPGRKVFDRAAIAPDQDPTLDEYDDNSFDGVSFTGVFDGKGHIIMNLTIEGNSFLGLFGQLGFGAMVSNLGLEAVDVNGAGGYIGGLVGYNYGSITTNYSDGMVRGNNSVGGLVGVNLFPGIATNYSHCTVSGDSIVGGLVGANVWPEAAYGGGIIVNSYSTGAVSGNELFGGLVGEKRGGAVITSFWGTQTSGQTTSAGGMGLTTAEMQDPKTFIDAGWDFKPHDVWVSPDEGSYPILWWQTSPPLELPGFSGGSGEPDNPYLISTADELNSIGHNPRLMSAHFKLTNDIDLTGIDFYSIGSEAFPFTGVFYGNSKKIFNFSHTSIDSDPLWLFTDDVGLFGCIAGENAAIKDLGLIDPDIDAGTGYGKAGALVGSISSGTISNCYVEGGKVSGDKNVGGLAGSNGGSINASYSTCTVTGNDYVGGLVGRAFEGNFTASYSTGTVTGNEYVGGLMGLLHHGSIATSYSTSTVSGNRLVGGLVGENWGRAVLATSYSTGAVHGNNRVGGLVGLNAGSITASRSTGAVSSTGWAVGGLVGENYYGIIIDSYSTRTVTGDWGVGGLAGRNRYDASITTSYSTGTVSGNRLVGGLVGENSWNASTTTSFWDIETSDQTISDGGIGLTTTEMQTAGTFFEVGWDFVDETTNGTDEIWWILEGQDYPRLWWEIGDETSP